MLSQATLLHLAVVWGPVPVANGRRAAALPWQGSKEVLQKWPAWGPGLDCSLEALLDGWMGSPVPQTTPQWVTWWSMSLLTPLWAELSLGSKSWEMV